MNDKYEQSFDISGIELNGVTDEEIAYENEFYKIVVGTPPTSREFPEPFDTYLVVNKQFDVVEYMNSMFPYAKHTADDLARVTKEGFGPRKEAEEDLFSKFQG